jgi:pimeloyl-ACP methyl ester carboxylesterase
MSQAVSSVDLTLLDLMAGRSRMTDRARPSLVFLHGVNNAANAQEWRPVLDVALARLGYPSLESAEVEVYAPHYAQHLAGAPSTSTAPARRVSKAKEDNDRVFEMAQARLRRLVRSEEAIETDRALEIVAPAANLGVATPKPFLPLQEANRYRSSEHVRNRVLSEVISGLPEGELVVVAHSLGSVIAMDLLGVLPPNREIVRLITLGSPLGIPAMTSYLTKRRRGEFPSHVVHSWLNALHPRDLVTGGRGLGGIHPQAHNIVLSGGMQHSSMSYVDDSRVALAIGEALFGSVSTELQRSNLALAERMSDAEAQAALGLAVSRNILAALRDAKRIDTADRYEKAMQVNIDTLRLEAERGRKTSGLSQTFLNNLGGAEDLDRRWSREQLLNILCSMVGHNFAAPYQIDVSDALQSAFQKTAASLGHGPELGRRCVAAHELVLRELGLKKSMAWRVGLAAVGVVLVAAATGGLALAAAPGLAGAAALTSALAAFGPGGMVGGLATAGTLLSTGTAAAATAVLNDGSPAVLESALINALTLASARKSLGYPDDLVAWELVSALHSGATEELQSIQSLSDKGADAVKHLKARVELIEKALDFLLEQDLAPDQLRFLESGKVRSGDPV